MAEANWALKTRQEIVQRFARWRASDAVTRYWHVSKQKAWVVVAVLLLCCSRAVISGKRLIVHPGINDSLSLFIWTIAHAWSTSAPEYFLNAELPTPELV